MTPTALLRPVIAVERRVTAAPGRRLGVSSQDLVDSVEISEAEILDDLLYPSRRFAVEAGADPTRNGGVER